MKKISFRPVYNRKNQLDAQGKALLQVEAYLERKKAYFSTHIRLTPQQWDSKRQTIKEHPNAEALNYQLREFILSLEFDELAIWKEGKTVSLEQLKETLTSKGNKSFLRFMKNEIESSPSKESTKRNRMTTLSLLSQFKERIDFNDLCPRIVYNFEKYLINLGFKNNTIAKHMKHFKQSINAAIDQSYISASKHPFHRYRIKTTKGHHTYLLPEELQKLEKLRLPKQHIALKASLEAFLFCCYTGIRYSDFTRLSEENIIYIDEDPWINFRSLKTGVETMLPIKLLFEGKAWKMLQRHRDNPSNLFKIKSNSSVNKELVRIGQLAGISKHYSFHTARHTNATLLIYKGANITTVQKLLGHKKISTTQIYSEVMRTTIVKDLKKCIKPKEYPPFP